MKSIGSRLLKLELLAVQRRCFGSGRPIRIIISSDHEHLIGVKRLREKCVEIEKASLGGAGSGRESAVGIVGTLGDCQSVGEIAQWVQVLSSYSKTMKQLADGESLFLFSCHVVGRIMQLLTTSVNLDGRVFRVEGSASLQNAHLSSIFYMMSNKSFQNLLKSGRSWIVNDRIALVNFMENVVAIDSHARRIAKTLKQREDSDIHSKMILKITPSFLMDLRETWLCAMNLMMSNEELHVEGNFFYRIFFSISRYPTIFQDKKNAKTVGKILLYLHESAIRDMSTYSHSFRNKVTSVALTQIMSASNLPSSLRRNLVDNIITKNEESLCKSSVFLEFLRFLPTIHYDMASLYKKLRPIFEKSIPRMDLESTISILKCFDKSLGQNEKLLALLSKRLLANQSLYFKKKRSLVEISYVLGVLRIHDQAFWDMLNSEFQRFVPVLESDEFIQVACALLLSGHVDYGTIDSIIKRLKASLSTMEFDSNAEGLLEIIGGLYSALTEWNVPAIHQDIEIITQWYSIHMTAFDDFESNLQLGGIIWKLGHRLPTERLAALLSNTKIADVYMSNSSSQMVASLCKSFDIVCLNILGALDHAGFDVKHHFQRLCNSLDENTLHEIKLDKPSADIFCKLMLKFPQTISEHTISLLYALPQKNLNILVRWIALIDRLPILPRSKENEQEIPIGSGSDALPFRFRSDEPELHHDTKNPMQWFSWAHYTCSIIVSRWKSTFGNP